MIAITFTQINLNTIFNLYSVFNQNSDSPLKLSFGLPPLPVFDVVLFAEFATPALAYSETLRSKKLVLPCKEIDTIQSNGFSALKYLGNLRATSSLSATNSMYCDMVTAFMPMRPTGRASVTNSFSHSTASRMIFLTVSGLGLSCNMLNNRHAKSQWRPSSREMNSLEVESPGMSPLFFNQNIEQKDPLKKMPSTAANATRRSPKESESLIHLSAQSAFFLMQGM